MIEFTAPIEWSMDRATKDILSTLFDAISATARSRTDKAIFKELSKELDDAEIHIENSTIINVVYSDLFKLEPKSEGALIGIVSFYHFTAIPDYEHECTNYYWSGSMVINAGNGTAWYYQFFEDCNADFKLTYLKQKINNQIA